MARAFTRQVEGAQLNIYSENSSKSQSILCAQLHEQCAMTICLRLGGDYYVCSRITFCMFVKQTRWLTVEWRSWRCFLQRPKITPSQRTPNLRFPPFCQIGAVRRAQSQLKVAITMLGLLADPKLHAGGLCVHSSSSHDCAKEQMAWASRDRHPKKAL
ncbi:hypothetical protein BDV19DRAFT_77662 [Aspergillus venezuelensis]